MRIFWGFGRFFSLFFLFLLLCGCGYQIGSLMHPQIKTAYVPPVENDTLAYNAAAQTRNLLTEVITTDGSLTLSTRDAADCEIYCRVKDVTYSESAWSTTSSSDDDRTPNQWTCSVKVEYMVILPGRGKPLTKGTASGTAEFISGPDMESARLNGMQQALYEACKNIISGITEAW